MDDDPVEAFDPAAVPQCERHGDETRHATLHKRQGPSQASGFLVHSALHMQEARSMSQLRLPCTLEAIVGACIVRSGNPDGPREEVRNLDPGPLHEARNHASGRV